MTIRQDGMSATERRSDAAAWLDARKKRSPKQTEPPGIRARAPVELRYVVPEPGEPADVILGPRDELARVEVLGRVRCRTVKYRAAGDHSAHIRLVMVRVPGEKEPRPIAVERFPRRKR